MNRLIVPLAALSFLVGVPSHVRAQACPASGYTIGGNGGYYEDSSTAPIWSWGSASYNLLLGTLSAGHTGSGETGSFLRLGISDRYRIVGPASGTPIPVTVRVSFMGEAGGGIVNVPYPGPMCFGSTVSMYLTSGSTTLQDQASSAPSPACGGQPFARELELVLNKLPGEDFVVSASVYLSAGQSTTATASGSLAFAGLPSGYTIQSCQGYAGSVVSAKPPSWGRIKQLYR